MSAVAEPPILGFTGQYSWLSNFAPARCRLPDDPNAYPTTEHAYQASKTTDSALRHQILSCRTAGDAKRWWKERRHLMRPDWMAVRVAVMLDLQRQKFAHPDLRRLLLATGEAQLIEVNSWHDTYWGVCRGEGLNMLGLLIMQVRNEINDSMIPG